MADLHPVFAVFAAVAIAFLSGCATPEYVQDQRGQGSKGMFEADYAKVFQAAVNACAQQSFMVMDGVNQSEGFIMAHTKTRTDSWGERIAIWVEELVPGQIEVEVVSRKVGPAVLFHYNWEDAILKSIAAQMAVKEI